MTIDDALGDVGAIENAERAGRARCVGNWSTGQILNHLATWADYSFDGMPLHPPFIIRLMLRPMKGRFLPERCGRSFVPKCPAGRLWPSAASLGGGPSPSFARACDSRAPTAPACYQQAA